MTEVVGAWERYWSAIDDRAASPWDADHERQTPGWLTKVGEQLPAGLPLVDVACGSGAQTRSLAGRFGTVIGVDVSPTAIDRARAPEVPGVTFEVLDILDPMAVAEFAARIGPAHVWTRFLLHHLPGRADRLRTLAGLTTLTGGHGRIFNCELLAMDRDAMIAYARRHPIAQTLYNAGVRPANLNPGELPALYRDAGLRVLATGRDEVMAVHSDTEGAFPIEWVLAAPG